MVLLAGVSKSKLFASSLMVLSLQSLADSTVNSNPSVSVRTATPLTACSYASEEAVSTTGKLLRCQGAKWTYQGVTDIERVFVSSLILSSDIGKNKTLIAYCPAGKRVLDGGCALLSGIRFHQAQQLIVSQTNSNMTAYQCVYGPLNAYAIDQYVSNNIYSKANISAEAWCGTY